MKQRNSQDGRPMCGFCMTGHHENCKPKIVWYDKEWLCYCEKCNNVVQSDESTNQQKEEENE